MTLRIYNSLSKKKEVFEPINSDKVKIYSCGPTVYDYFHIGNARAFIVPDIIKRYLEYQGYQVYHVLNFTDIDDKMIKRAKEEGVSVKELADKFIAAYFSDTKSLNIKQADAYPKATEHIEDMIDVIQKLLEKDYAYQNGGDVYFRVDKFAEYGKLSGQKPKELKAGSRVEVNQEKESPLDFSLWKESKAGEPSWSTPWGEGRPGWHIECSAMSESHLGAEFDIHTGGVDLKFPHHENEIAQSEAYCGHQVVKYWVHNGYINIDGEKMSKSLGNFFTTREILAKYSPETIRLFLLSKHYRNPINFSEQELDSAKKGLTRLKNTMAKLNNLIAKDGVYGEFNADDLEKTIKEKKAKFIAAMDDDFNTALALATLYEMATEINSFVNQAEFKLTYQVKTSLYKIKNIFAELSNQVLGIGLESESEKSQLLSDTVDLLLETREEVRKEEQYQIADDIRDGLEEIGIAVNDTPQGPEWNLRDDDNDI